MIPRGRFFLLNAFHIIVDGLFDSVPILLTFMLIHFGGNESAIGIVVACGALLGTLGGLGTPFFVDRLGFLPILAWTAFLYGLGFFANAFAPTALFAGIFFVAAMAGQTLFHNAAFSYLTANTERRRLGRTMSDFTAYGDIGRIPLTALAGYFAAGTLFGHPGWRSVCLLYGIVALALGMGLLAIAFRRTEGRIRRGKGTRLLPSAALLRNRPIGYALAASMLNAFSGDQIFVFMPLLMLSKGFDPKAFASMAFGFTLGCFVGKMACGRFLDRYGNRTVFIACELFMAAVLLGLILAQSIGGVTVLALLAGIVSKGTVPVVQTIITEPVRGDRYEDIFALNSLVRGATHTGAPLLFGFVGTRSGIAAAYLIMAVGSLAAVIPIALMGRDSAANVGGAE